MKKEKAQLMFKLAFSKRNWGAKYDRIEHYKRFPNLNHIIKELNKINWLLIKKKSNYTGISLNPQFKKIQYLNVSNFDSLNILKRNI